MTGKRNPQFGIPHTVETKSKISKANKGRISNRRIAIEINGIKYVSLNEATKLSNYSYKAVRKIAKQQKLI